MSILVKHDNHTYDIQDLAIYSDFFCIALSDLITKNICNQDQDIILDLSHEPKKFKIFLDILTNPADIKYDIYQVTTVLKYIDKYNAHNLSSILLNTYSDVLSDIIINHKYEKIFLDWFYFSRYISINDNSHPDDYILENMTSDYIISFENITNNTLDILKKYLKIVTNISQCKFISFDMRVFPSNILDLLVDLKHVKYIYFKNIRSNNIHILKLKELKKNIKIITKDDLLENYIINNDFNHHYDIFHINEDIIELICYIFHTSYTSDDINHQILDQLFNRLDYENIVDHIYYYAIKNSYTDMMIYTYNKTKLLPVSSYENTVNIIYYASPTVIYWLINKGYKFDKHVIDICMRYKKYEYISFFILDGYKFSKTKFVNQIIVCYPDLLKLVVRCGGLFDENSFYLLWTYTDNLDLMRYAIENKCPVKKFLQLKKSRHIEDYIREHCGVI